MHPNSQNKSYCGSCYGANAKRCCHTCDDVRRAYEYNGWMWNSEIEQKVVQCSSTAEERQRTFTIVIPREGMPHYENPNNRGDLHVTVMILPATEQLPPIPTAYCPNDCSGFGFCNITKGYCDCFDGRGGADCSISAEEIAFFQYAYAEQQRLSKEILYWSILWHTEMQRLRQWTINHVVYEISGSVCNEYTARVDEVLQECALMPFILHRYDWNIAHGRLWQPVRSTLKHWVIIPLMMV